MARLFPNKPVGTISPEAAKVLHGLRRLPGDELLVWIKLPVLASPDWRPDMMVVDRDRSCHLIAVSPLTESSIQTALHGDLFAAPGTVLKVEEIGFVERKQLHVFRESVLKQAGQTEGAVRPPIRLVVAFPNVPQVLLDEVVSRAGVKKCAFWGRETIRSEALMREIEAVNDCGRTLPKSVFNCLRERFSPEISIPESFIARLEEKASRDVSAKLTGFLLDIDQEWLAKEDLALSGDAASALSEQRLRLVTGVAGSGKTLILLYRAMMHATLHPEAKILILTHNRPLTGELRDRFNQICPGRNLSWRTFYQWCRDISGPHWRDIIPPWEREPLLREMAGKNPALARLPFQFLCDELDWIRDQALVRRDDYLSASRIGRKRRLNEEQRRAIFSLLREYQTALASRNLTDWAGAAFSAWGHVSDGQIKPPIYDLVFIDEAQFFAPVWLQLVNHCIEPERSRLFIASDPTQGFLKRRQSWISSGLDMRGHSVRLLRAYRNTREILNFAASFYRKRLPDEDEEINLPEPKELARLPAGEPPQFIKVDSPQGERARVANEIVSAIRTGSHPEHFLVLLVDDAMVDSFIETLNHVAKEPIARNLKELSDTSTGRVRVSSLNAATGLESPIVFLCGLDSLFEKEQSLGLDAADREEILRDNTRRIYMAVTRAGRKLLITYLRPGTRKLLDAEPMP
jgi:hypothetical protein